MANYLDLAGLTVYDKKIKEWIKSGTVDITEEAIRALFVTVAEGPADNEIWYTTSDGVEYDLDSIIKMMSTDDTPYTGPTLISNEFDDEKQMFVMKFNGDVTALGINTDIDAGIIESIDGPLFMQSNIETVVLPNSITHIGYFAFAYCSSLTSIAIPNSVTSIGEVAFLDCSSLTSVTIPNGVTSIVEGAFRACSSLTYIVVEEGNTYYDSRENCNAIIETTSNTLIVGCQNTIIPNSVTSIEKWAFLDCSSLTSITIPNSVTIIGEDAFSNCSSLTSVTIHDSVTSIGDSAFSGCSSLTSPVYNAHCFAYMPTSYSGAYTIPEGIKQISGSAFNGCSSLTSITIPNGVTSIRSHVFDRCSSLNSVTIGNSVTSIGEYAFSWCSSLTSITIPNSVTSIGKGALYECSSLTSIIFDGTIDQWNAITKGEEWNTKVPATYVQCSDGQVEI